MINFGKYRNKTLKEISLSDEQYCKWLLTQPWFNIKHPDKYNELKNILNSKINKNTELNNCFIIYTDGACKNNGSTNAKSGIGIHFSLTNKIKINDISEKLITDKHTNNKAELTAILKSLELCDKYNINEKIVIYTDSDYSIKCITLWYKEWVLQNKTKDRKNIDILHKINHYYQKYDIIFNHIRSHTGLTDIHSKGNEIADRLATECL